MKIPDDLEVDKLWAACMVFILDKKISTWLKQNDPKALEQAMRACKIDECEECGSIGSQCCSPDCKTQRNGDACE